MPIHDWTRVSAGTFHAFHLAWIAQLQQSLNSGLLPDDFYALGEQVAGDAIPDVLTLQDMSDQPDGDSDSGGDFDADGGGVSLATALPQVSTVSTISEATLLTLKHRRIVLRHATGDRVVALLEIVSPGNKQGRGPMEALVDKAVASLQQGYHLLMIDLLPPGPFDPDGLHDRIWQEIDGEPFAPPAGRPLTLAAYRVSDGVTAYVEPVAVGQALPEMPLFFTPDRYVNVPLAETYAAAYAGVPKRWRRVIEGVG